MFGRYRNPRKVLSAEEVKTRLEELEKKAAAGKVASEVGECQACEARQKLELDRMLTFHGYKRPGHGSTVGTCPGVGHPPYELSCELVKKIKAQAEDRLANLRAAQDKAKAGELERFYVETRKGHVEVTKDDPHWNLKLHGYIEHLGYRIREAEAEVKRLEWRIQKWEPKEIKSVVEEEKKRIAMTEVRRAEKQAARDTKLAKKAALQEKRDAAKDKRLTALAEFVKLLQAAQASGDRTAALRVWEIANAKKNAWLWDYDLSGARSSSGFDEAAVALGLARREGQRIGYEHSMSKSGAKAFEQAHWRFGVQGTLEPIYNRLGESMGSAVVALDAGSTTAGTARMASGPLRVKVSPKGWTADG
jgi:hypothetical protein